MNIIYANIHQTIKNINDHNKFFIVSFLLNNKIVSKTKKSAIALF